MPAAWHSCIRPSALQSIVLLNFIRIFQDLAGATYTAMVFLMLLHHTDQVLDDEAALRLPKGMFII